MPEKYDCIKCLDTGHIRIHAPEGQTVEIFCGCKTGTAALDKLTVREPKEEKKDGIDTVFDKIDSGIDWVEDFFGDGNEFSR